MKPNRSSLLSDQDSSRRPVAGSEQHQAELRRGGVVGADLDQQLAVGPFRRRPEASAQPDVACGDLAGLRIDDMQDVVILARDQRVELLLVAAQADLAAMAELMLLADGEGRDAPARGGVEDMQFGIIVVEPDMVRGDEAVRLRAMTPRRQQPVAAVGIAGDPIAVVDRLDPEHASPAQLQMPCRQPCRTR